MLRGRVPIDRETDLFVCGQFHESASVTWTPKQLVITDTLFMSVRAGRTDVSADLFEGNIDLESVEYIGDSTSFEVIFNRCSGSWDYNRTSNRWWGEQEHTFEVFVMCVVGVNQMLVLANQPSPTFRIRSSKNNQTNQTKKLQMCPPWCTLDDLPVSPFSYIFDNVEYQDHHARSAAVMTPYHGDDEHNEGLIIMPQRKRQAL